MKITTTDTLSKIVAFYKTLNDSIISFSTITIAGIFRRTLTDSLQALDSGISKLIGKPLFNTDKFSVADTIRRYLNGLIINPWTKRLKQ